MAVQPAQLAHAILTSALDGAYPESDLLAGAELPVAALPSIVAYLQKAQDDVQEDMRKTSRANAPELDAWIAQARQLHADIAASGAHADAILALARAEAALQRECESAQTRARALAAEIAFHDALAGVLGRLQAVGETLAHVERAGGGGAIAALAGAEDALERMGGGPTVVIALMRERAAALRRGLREKVDGGWRALIDIDTDAGSIRIHKEIAAAGGEGGEGGGGSVSGESLVEALRALELLDSKVDQLHQQIDALIIAPRLDVSRGTVPALSQDADTLRIAGRSTDLSADRMFADLRLVFGFLDARLPRSVTATLSRILVPSLTTRLRTSTLSRSVPASLDDLPQFEALLAGVRRFEDYLQQIRWTAETDLREWADRAPKVWLAKKTETCLDRLRQIVARGIAETKVVERTETQTVESGPAAPDEAWNEDWKDEGELPAVAESPPADIDDGEASGWGLDEDLDIEEEEEEEEEEQQKPADEGLDDLDWGEWGEDADEPSAPPTPSAPPPPPAAQIPPPPPPPPPRAVTLRENYTVTSVPDAVLAVVVQVIGEARRLSALPASSITPAARGLLSLPTLILAAYRALAPIHYAADTASNMHLYNDCVRLSEQLAGLDPQRGLSFAGDVALISLFGKRVYAKEMAGQRIILTDYLEGTQGFVRCTEYPQSLACETAVSSVISRLRELHAAWSPVLSLSALSQAVGSLLNTVVVRLVHDVEDMSDIPEAESVKLAGFMEDLAQLESLFPVGPSGVSTAGVYCANWIKFRFLQQVLESSMADILYMFREGHLEGFEEGALCDLVKALFADSENRRKCIDEIRRGRTQS